MKNKKKKINLLDLIPVRNVEWVNNEQNLIVLLKPKFTNRWLGKYILPRLKSPNYKVNLDAYGSFVWNNCDGKTTVAEIGERLKKEFGEDIEPVYERLCLFIKTLKRNRFVCYKEAII